MNDEQFEAVQELVSKVLGPALNGDIPRALDNWTDQLNHRDLEAVETRYHAFAEILWFVNHAAEHLPARDGWRTLYGGHAELLELTEDQA